MLCFPSRLAFLPLARSFNRTHRSLVTFANESPVLLRSYQEGCLEACTDALKSGLSRIGVSLPTGSGKTTVFVSLLSRIPAPASDPEAARSLIIVNGIELARQAAAQAYRMDSDWTIEIEQGTKYKASGLADVTIATYQTLLQDTRLAKFDPSKLKAIIVDEAHHAAAPSYRKILSHFHPEIKNPSGDFVAPSQMRRIPIIGFSATFSRHDGLALGSVFERIVYHRSFLEMMKEQWLCNVRFTSVHASLNLSNVTISSRSGDFVPKSLAQVVNTDTVNKLVVQSWMDKAATRKSTLVFCVNLAHVQELTKTFREAGVDARYLYSLTPAKERLALITSFKEGGFPVLLNCAILTEGADIPNIDCVIVAKPTRSRNVFAQMIGRGMRLSPGSGKEDCHIIDFVDSTSRVANVVSVPTLFGLDPSELIDDEDIESLEKRAPPVVDEDNRPLKLDTNDQIPDPKSVTYTDYEDPFALVDSSSGAPHIATISRNAWVGCGADIYILECMGKGHIRIERVKGNGDEEDHYRGHYNSLLMNKQTAKTLRLAPYGRSQNILTARTLDEAVRGCDTYAKSKVVRGSLAKSLLRSAKWRHLPASDHQKQFISKRWSKQSNVTDLRGFAAAIEKDDRNKKIHKMTKGEAANIITRLKHGAENRYKKKIQAEQMAVMRMEKRKQKQKQKLDVSNFLTGPIDLTFGIPDK